MVHVIPSAIRPGPPPPLFVCDPTDQGPSHAISANARILIVEDDPGTLKACQTLLTQAGFAVVTATSVDEGLCGVMRGPVDLIVLDLRLGRSDGLELLRRLRATEALVRAVIVTGYGSIESAVEAVKLGAVDYVLKPLFADELVEVVERALGLPTRAAVQPAPGSLPREVKGAADYLEKPLIRDDLAPLVQSVSRPDPFGSVSRKGPHRGVSVVVDRTTILDARIEDVIRIIEREFGAPLTIENLAARVGLGGSRLRHLFRETVGVPLARFRRERQLEVAEGLLLRTHKRVSEIAAGCLRARV